MSQGYAPQQGGYPPQGGAYAPPPAGYAPPPQPGYAGPPGGQPYVAAGGTTVVVQTAPVFGPSPVQMQCPHCTNNIVSKVDFVVGKCTWIVACLLFWFAAVILSPIPCCVDSCKDARHTCPNCKQVLGVYQRGF